MTWIDTFVAEKGWDLDFLFEVEGPQWGTNYIPLAVVVDAIKATTPEERDRIKSNLIRLDFFDPDGPWKYMAHLAKALAK